MSFGEPTSLATMLKTDRGIYHYFNTKIETV